ncbi:hypothetical protein EST38_g12793 [Candolleomyces aberdarensis]|uniref:AIG1-type G domain-containing protein n=1 Tax=Candolleomyces aberdarensis TaxID=2316362 RepID=A0A4Q2D3T8_9AGAR|nr:hypothetical protein EST38_g12793 [Candolleomyces aberdarensis]
MYSSSWSATSKSHRSVLHYNLTSICSKSVIALSYVKNWSNFGRIMGATGAGKSSFINSVLRHLGSNRRVQVGEELVSCTSQLESVIVDGQIDHWRPVKGYRIVLVDTPGLDDTYIGDFAILQRIARWLEESCRERMVLGGVVYLHDISQNRFTGAARRNLEIFNHLCGDSALDNVVLVTSKWGRAPGREIEKREGELKNNHWKTMLDGKARVERLVAGEEDASAWGVVRSILDKVETRAIQQPMSEALLIQKELTNCRKCPPQTHAAGELRTQLQQMLEAQTQMLALEADAVAWSVEAQAQLQGQEEKVRQMARQIENLKVSLPKPLAQWLGLFMGA